MKYKFTRAIILTTVCIAIISGTSIAQYRKMNFATAYVSGSNVSNGTNALGFNPTNSGAFSTGPATFAGGGLFSGSTDVATYTFGEESETTHDTIYLKIQSSTLVDVDLDNITIQPLDGGANAGNAGHPILYSYPSVTSSGLSDGRMLMYAATAKFDGVKITYNAPSFYGPSLSLYETFFKSQGKPWPQDCDRPFESISNVSGLTIANFSNPYDIMDNGSDYLSTYSSMSYAVGSIGATFTQEIYFPSPGSGTDEIRLQAGEPANLLTALLSYGGDIADNVTVQPYLNDSATESATTLSNIISVQFGPLTTLINLISGNNIKPIYYKPGVPFNKVVIKWSIPVALGTLNQFAFYDIRRVAETPKISTADSQAVCINTTGLQLVAKSLTDEPNLTYQWYAKNPNGSIDSTPIAVGDTITIPDSYLATAGHKVFYVAAVRSVCGSVISDADSAIVQVYAKPVFKNAALASTGTVGLVYPNTVITTDSAATYSVSGLPDGLNFNSSTATISGTPTTAGTFDVVVTATPTNGPGCPTTITYHVTISNPATTPVTITNFSGNLIKGTANLAWNTGIENNFNYFIIQKSTDGKSYNEIPNSKIDAKGNGSAYTFSTAQTEPDAYYRLVAVDKDGSKLIEDKVVYLSQKIATLEIYPNPTKDNLYIISPIAAKVVIYDAIGRIVITQDIKVGSNTIKVSALSAGVYFGKLDNQQFKFIKK